MEWTGERHGAGGGDGVALGSRPVGQDVGIGRGSGNVDLRR